MVKTLLNSEKSVVKSMALVRVNFTNSFQLSKVIIARGLGVIQKWNNPPKGYVGPEIRNLNLPVYR